MRTQVSWSLALMALVMSGSLTTGCKSSKDRRGSVDGGSEDGSIEGDGGQGEGGTPGFVLSRTAGLQTDEVGKTDTFTVALASRPSGNVTIALSSSDESEGKVGPAELVFTSSDWNAPRTVTVTGQQDEEEDGPKEYKVRLGAAVSTDSTYSGRIPGEVTVTNIDDDTAGITVIGAENLSTYEPSVPATYQVKLNTKPLANVQIALTSSDLTEVTVAPATLVFTVDNWNAPQDVTLTGVDDSDVDGPITVKITGAISSAGDAEYSGLAVPEVSVVNRDNETAGFIVVPTENLRTFEDGRSQDQFYVALNARPTANVTVGVTSSAVDEATVNKSSLTFTPDNWNAPQTVIVSGIDDADIDQDQPFTIVLAPATSADTRYAGANPADVTGLNIDNETANIIVDDEQLVAVEGFETASFTLSLTTAPTGNVQIPLSSLTPAQATVSPASVTFTATNWAAPQRVTITAVNDIVQDGNQQVTIDIGAALSADDRYGDLDAANLTVTVVDNDTPGLYVRSIKLTTSEAGETGSFSVVLFTKPTAPVSVPVKSLDEGEITLNTANLTFTVDNWASPQVVTLNGIDDTLVDGNQRVELTTGPATSMDAAYAGKSWPSQFASNVDNDVAGVSVLLPPTTPGQPDGVMITDEDGRQAKFKIALQRAPSSNVTFSIAVSKPLEATISLSTVTFTPTNWSGQVELTLRGLDDDDSVDGDQPYEVIFGAGVSDDVNYKDFVPARLSAKNLDNDTPGIVPVLPVLPANVTWLTTSENATAPAATFDVRLRSRPASPVTLTVTSDLQTEGQALPVTITITPDDYRSLRRITVQGQQDDRVADGPRDYKILIGSASEDPNYAGLTTSVDVRNEDDDSAGFDVTYAAAPLDIRENGKTDTLWVRLDSKPTSNVTLGVRSTDTDEGRLSTALITFTPDDWNSLHPVIITGVGDLEQDGNQRFFVEFGPIAGDAVYAALPAPEHVEVENVDVDSAGLGVTAINLIVGESASSAVGGFRVAVQQPPAVGRPVRVDIEIPDGTEGSFSSTSLVTSTSVLLDSVDTSREVAFYGRNDDIADRDQTFQIVFAPAVSDDPNYAGRIIPALTATNVDDDSPGTAFVGLVQPLSPREGAPPASFALQLATEPVGTVRIPVRVTPSDQVELAGGLTYLEFTNADWNGTNHTVTVNAINDLFADGAQPFTVEFGPITAVEAPDDPNYVGVTVTPVTGLAYDNDDAAVVVTPVSPTPGGEQLRTYEDQTRLPDRFTVVLNARPTQNVTVTIAPSIAEEGRVLPTTLTFTPDLTGPNSYAVAQTVEVFGVDDAVEESDREYFVNVSAPTSADPAYAAVPAQSLTAINIDDDQVGIDVNDDLTANTTEAGTTTTFTIKLTSEPTQPVTIPVVSLEPSELSVAGPVVIDATNWRTPTVVTVTGVDESIADGNKLRAIRIGPASSGDTDYDGLLGPTPLNPTGDFAYVNITNEDNDTAGLTFGGFASAPAQTLSTYEVNAIDTFTVQLRSQPLAPVRLVISVDPAGASEVTVTPELTFTTTDWATPQLVTVAGVNDGVLDHGPSGSKPFVIRFQTDTTDPTYTALPQNIAPNAVNGTSYEASRSCLALLADNPTPKPPSGTYWLDTDGKGPATRFRGYCDNETDNGGWTLLSWTRSSEDWGGLPYPGTEVPSFNTVDLNTISVGSGVPASGVDALFDQATQLAQGQTITDTPLSMFTTNFKLLKDYEFAGSFNYGSLADLSISIGPGECTELRSGTYTTLAGDPIPVATPPRSTVYLSQSLRAGPGTALNDYTAGLYRWSIGNSTGYCETNGTAPASFAGTWLDAQYGPRYENAAGAYSVWVR